MMGDHKTAYSGYVILLCDPERAKQDTSTPYIDDYKNLLKSWRSVLKENNKNDVLITEFIGSLKPNIEKRRDLPEGEMLKEELDIFKVVHVRDVTNTLLYSRQCSTAAIFYSSVHAKYLELWGLYTLIDLLRCLALYYHFY